MIGFLSLRNLAVLWTDQMWFSSVGLGKVFSTLLMVKLGLGLTFGAIFFFIMWGNLLLTDRFGARDLSFDPEDEVVRRFQNVVRPYAKRIYAAIALVMGLIAGLNATGQWNKYLLFANSQPFHIKDALFHKDLSFYVFTLPFVSFVVTWLLVSLIVALIITTGFHYLNGGIRATRVTPRVSPRVKAHLSVIGAGIALMKAAGYVIAKWELVNSTNGFVQGAGYTDVHARMPALTILFFLSMAAALILLANVRLRGWSLPAVAVGLWLFVAIVIGVLYPTILQALKVSPNQDSLEAPYIQRNIEATRAAFGLDKVKYSNFAASPTITDSTIKADNATLNNIRLWDPAANIALGERDPSPVDPRVLHVHHARRGPLLHQRQAHARADRRAPAEHGEPALAVVGEPAPAVHPRDRRRRAPGERGRLHDRQSELRRLERATAVHQRHAGPDPARHLLRDQGPRLGRRQHQAARARLPGELRHQRRRTVETHYDSTGGVAVGNIFSRMALALRLGDFNFLISNQITSKSRVLFVRDVQQMAQKAAPFLTFDSNPYAVIANGEVQYVIDGYTTTDQYPYSENASNLNVNQGGLPSSFNYVRNSVKVVVNAYTGAMTFYANDPNDPILKAYRAAFPTMFHPMSQMPEAIRTHLRYPSNIFSVQAATSAKYHISTASAFFAASDRWEVSPTTGSGSREQSLGPHHGDERRRQRGLLVARTDESDLPGRFPAREESPTTPGEHRVRAGRELLHRPGPHGVHDRHERSLGLRASCTCT